MPGSDGSCCLGTYTCVATNCMGGVTSSAALLGIDDGSLVGRRGSRDAGDARSGATAAATAAAAALPDVQTPDISDGNLKPFSLSTIQEERTSQLMSPEAPTTAIEDLDHHQESEAATTTTLREEEEETTEAVAPKLATTAVVEADVEQEENKDNFNENNEQFSVSVGKADENGDVSISIGNQEMTLSLYRRQTSRSVMLATSAKCLLKNWPNQSMRAAMWSCRPCASCGRQHGPPTSIWRQSSLTWTRKAWRSMSP